MPRPYSDFSSVADQDTSSGCMLFGMQYYYTENYSWSSIATHIPNSYRQAGTLTLVSYVAIFNKLDIDCLVYRI